MERGAASAAITGWGMAVPDAVLTNADLERLVDTSDEWIASRTGIRERRIAGPNDSTTSLSVRAARQALFCANLTPDDLDLIVVGTCTADQLLVSQACLVQAELGGKAAAFDVGAACAGFVYALSVGSQFIQTGMYRRVLVLGVDTLTRFIDYTDRTTCVLFGDGAGAVVLEASDQTRGLLSTVLGADGAGYRHLYVPGWRVPNGESDSVTAINATPAAKNGFTIASSVDATVALASAEPELAIQPTPLDLALNRRPTLPNTPAMIMRGNEVFRFAVTVMGDSAAEAVEKAGLTLNDVNMFIPHQANARIIDAAARRLGLNRERVWVNVDRYGNTSAGSVPIALCEAADAGTLREGDNVVFVAFGGGLAWAAGVVRWGTAGVLGRDIPEVTEAPHVG